MREPALLAPVWGRQGPVRVCSTTRRGGFATGLQATFSLDPRPDVDPAVLEANRQRLRSALSLPAEPAWLHQVHGREVVDASAIRAGERPEADAVWTDQHRTVCAILTADCLPVALADRDGRAVAVAHAGWRGLAGGVIEATVAALPVGPERLRAWLGPAIGPRAFEVGPEVRAAFIDADPAAATAFRRGRDDRWLADLYGLARRRLQLFGITDITGGGHCTFSDPERFFSYRRDGAATGRMATLAWLESAPTGQ